MSGCSPVGKTESNMYGQESDHIRRNKDFVGLYQQHERNLHGYVLSLLPDTTAAEEICQETSLRLWEQFEQFDRSKDFGAWARTIAYYQVLKYRKKLGRERLQFSSELLAVLADRASVRCDELASRQSHLIQCLQKLGEMKRQAIRLYYGLGMTANDVAEKLGRSIAAIEKLLVRTRNDLRQCVETAMRREERP
jgi:RNA polymerase sigma-70 factor, ECF subfamily